MWPSITDISCTCNYLQNEADEPDSPVEFDARMNEFHFVYQTNGNKTEMIIRHCPFCGGKAPQSKRTTLFAKISDAERNRLLELTRNLHTIEEVFAALGPPDIDNPNGWITESPEKDGEPGKVQAYRTLVYENLSETAKVNMTVHAAGQVAISFSGKYLGNKAA